VNDLMDALNIGMLGAMFKLSGPQIIITVGVYLSIVNGSQIADWFNDTLGKYTGKTTGGGFGGSQVVGGAFGAGGFLDQFVRTFTQAGKTFTASYDANGRMTYVETYLPNVPTPTVAPVPSTGGGPTPSWTPSYSTANSGTINYQIPVKGARAAGGYISSTGPYLLHAGEMVTPANQVGDSFSPNINITVNTSGGVDGRALSQQIMSELRTELRMRSLS
jgi:hypothetical protein